MPSAGEQMTAARLRNSCALQQHQQQITHECLLIKEEMCVLITDDIRWPALAALLMITPVGVRSSRAIWHDIDEGGWSLSVPVRNGRYRVEDE